MIKYDTDGMTLIGPKGRVGPLDGAGYSDLLVILDAQINADGENKTAVEHYTNALKNAQASVDIGRGETVSAPPKPLQHLVDDNGVSTYVAFSPALPDLQPPPAATPSGALAQPTIDKQAIMFSMISAMFRKEFPTST
jgi:hypothetical protein